MSKHSGLDHLVKTIAYVGDETEASVWNTVGSLVDTGTTEDVMLFLSGVLASKARQLKDSIPQAA